jgi:hypothetical protein
MREEYFRILFELMQRIEKRVRKSVYESFDNFGFSDVNLIS